MGVAGFAMLGAFVGLIMTIVTGIKYLYWKHHGVPTVGTFGETVSSRVEYKSEFSSTVKAIHYKHELVIQCDEQQFGTTFVEVVSGENPSKIKPGDKINLLWNASSKMYFNVDEARTKLKQYPIMFVICVVLFFACAFIVTALA